MRGILALVFFFGFYQGVFAANKSDSIEEKLFAGIKSGNLEEVTELIGKIEDINAVEYKGIGNLLMVAVVNGKLDIVDLLISKGVNVKFANDRGYTALHEAADKGRLDILNRLLDAKADVATLTKDKKTALHLASYGGHTKVCEQLIAAARDAKEIDLVAFVNILNANGFTALHNAIDRGYEVLSKVILEAGAYISVGTSSHVDRARIKKIIKLLSQYAE